MMRVLLVDDDVEYFLLVREYLSISKTTHFELSCAAGYDEGLSLLREHPFDIVLVDYRLQDQNGIAFLHTAALEDITTPIILLTGLQQEEMDQSAMQAGAADFLHKDEVTPALLERVIRHAVRRKREEERKQEIESNLRSQVELLSRLRIPVIASDPKLKITYWNKAAEETFGWTETEVLGRTTTELFQSEFTTMDTETAHHFLRREGHLEGEGLFQCKDGRRIPAQVNAILLRGEHGEMQGILSSLEDISTRKRSELLSQALNDINLALHSAQDFDCMMELVLEEAYAALGSDTAAISIKENGGWTIRFVQGFSPEIIGSSMDDDEERHAVLAIQTMEPVAVEDAGRDERVNRDHLQKWGIQSVLVVPIVAHAQAIGAIFFNYALPTRFTAAQIDFAWKLSSAISLAIENNQLVKNLEKEILKHKLTEEALRQSEERFRLALQNSPITVFIQDLDLRYTWLYNPGSDLEPESVVGTSDFDNFNPQDAEMLSAVKRQVIETGEQIRGEYDVVLNGQRVILHGTFEPLYRDGKIAGVIGAAVDITNVRLLQQQKMDDQARIEIQRQLIAQREQERLQIARDLHDGPLQDLVGLSFSINNLEYELQGHPELAKPVDALAADLSRIISELRSFASGLRPPALTDFGLEKAIHSHLDDFRQKHPELQINFIARQSGDILPETPRLALYRIYQELLNNIVKHAAATQVDIFFTKDEQNAVLMVQDNGRGFFIPKNWLDLARKKHLGLVGIRERAEAVDGTVEIESAPGRGTSVTVSIPLVPVVESV